MVCSAQRTLEEHGKRDSENFFIFVQPFWFFWGINSRSAVNHKFKQRRMNYDTTGMER